MKKTILTTLPAVQLLATNEEKITIINQDSQNFLLGKETHINMKFVPNDASDMWLKAGVRILGTLESKQINSNDIDTADITIQDAYLRRVRFEVAAGFGEHSSFVMDMRNDKSNYGIDNEEGQFSVGDAYVKIKKPFNSSLLIVGEQMFKPMEIGRKKFTIK